MTIELVHKPPKTKEIYLLCSDIMATTAAMRSSSEIASTFTSEPSITTGDKIRPHDVSPLALIRTHPVCMRVCTCYTASPPHIQHLSTSAPTAQDMFATAQRDCCSSCGSPARHKRACMSMCQHGRALAGKKSHNEPYFSSSPRQSASVLPSRPSKKSVV